MALLGGGGNAEYVVADADHLLPVPASLAMPAAAAVPEVWLTAFQLLHLVAGGVKPGQSVLVHAGGSGVGTGHCRCPAGQASRREEHGDCRVSAED